MGEILSTRDIYNALVTVACQKLKSSGVYNVLFCQQRKLLDGSLGFAAGVCFQVENTLK